jgi:hypothetical protein
MMKLNTITAITGDTTVVASPPVVEVFHNAVSEKKSNAIRLGKCGWKRKDDAALPSNKRKPPAHGADNFLRYNELVKAESFATSLRVRDERWPYIRAGKSKQATLKENGVSLNESTCREHVKKAFDNGCVGLEPQRS